MTCSCGLPMHQRQVPGFGRLNVCSHCDVPCMLGQSNGCDRCRRVGLKRRP